MELTIFLLMIFIIVITVRQKMILEKDKYYLREDNISLRNDLKRALLGQEIFERKSQKREKSKSRGKNKKSGKAAKKKGRIFIFENAETEEDAKNMDSFRNLLKEHSIESAILVNFAQLSLKMSDDKKEAVIEEMFLLEGNRDNSNLPIIFYGGNGKDYLEFILFLDWEDRLDMEWIKDPWKIEDLKEALEDISRDIET